MERITSGKDLEALRLSWSIREQGAITLSVCGGTGCRANASRKVFEALEAEVRRTGGQKKILLKRTGCHGFCEKGPVIIVYPSHICYVKVKPADAAEIISQALLGGPPIKRLLWSNGIQTAERFEDIPFYRRQKRRLLADGPRIDPLSIEDYIGCGGYAALRRALESMTPEAVVAEIKKSGLRGRGGGGFPTAAKWEAARAASGSTKYVVVNGDEGDPGAFMDSGLMEGNPHSVIE
ncbi:MAG TPA: NAD(P)H-dependent oxidoreductase subunit E, partial [Chitinivibrionales bacterium]